MDREKREYGVTELATMRSCARDPSPTDFRIVLYGRICETWRMLVDVRFKLLALVPTLSVLGIDKLLQFPPEGSLAFPREARLIVALVGLLATTGLLIYDLRNSKLHDDLISRGRRIEDELEVDTGLFRGRPKSTNWLIKHDRATALIYGASLLGWMGAILVILRRP